MVTSKNCRREIKYLIKKRKRLFSILDWQLPKWMLISLTGNRTLEWQKKKQNRKNRNTWFRLCCKFIKPLYIWTNCLQIVFFSVSQEEGIFWLKNYLQFFPLWSIWVMPLLGSCLKILFTSYNNYLPTQDLATCSLKFIPMWKFGLIMEHGKETEGCSSTALPCLCGSSSSWILEQKIWPKDSMAF